MTFPIAAGILKAGKLVKAALKLDNLLEGGKCSMTVTGENYKAAREIYARAGVDTDEALRLLNEIPVSIHCWQIDDLGGFSNPPRA